jgi:hypothetical protein
MTARRCAPTPTHRLHPAAVRALLACRGAPRPPRATTPTAPPLSRRQIVLRRRQGKGSGTGKGLGGAAHACNGAAHAGNGAAPTATEAAATEITAAELGVRPPLGCCAVPGAPYTPQLSGPPLPPCEEERYAFIKSLEILVRPGEGGLRWRGYGHGTRGGWGMG